MRRTIFSAASWATMSSRAAISSRPTPSTSPISTSERHSADGDGRRFSLAAPAFALHIADMVYRRIEFSGSGWRGRIGTILAVALGLGLAAALLLLSLGIALLLLPVVAIAFLIGRWRWKK